MTTTPSSPERPAHMGEPWRRPASRVHFSTAAASASDYARALVPVIADDQATPGEFVQRARRLRVWAMEVMTAAVLAERAHGATWQQVAAAFGYETEFVRARWEPVERAWLQGRRPDLDGLDVGSLDPPLSDADARKAAEQLDQWCERQGAPHGAADRGREPVSRLYDGQR